MIRRIPEILGYLFAATIIVLGTVVLIAYGNGYSYSFKTHKLSHNGLAILQSAPSGAQVTIDGKALKKKTPYRKTLSVGKHSFSVAKDGYRTWSKDIDIVASEVSLAQYIILLPQKPKTETLTSFSSVFGAKPSTDRKRLAVIVPGGSDAGLWSVDTGGSKNRTKLYTPKAATDAEPAETLTAVNWSQDSSHVLLQTAVGSKPVFYVIAANGNGDPVNVSDMFKFDFPGLVFDPANWRQLYWNSDEGLRRLDIGNQTISAVLADHVAAFGFAGDRIMYVDASRPVRSLWLLDRGGHRTSVAAQIPEGQSYTLDFATFIGTPQIALTAQPAGTTVFYSDVFSDHVTAKPLAATGINAKFNGEGRYILLLGVSSLAVYDVQKQAVYQFPFQGEPVTNIEWFDNYHVLFDRGGQTVFSEFDGTNTAPMAKTGLAGATNTNDGKSIVTVGPAANGAVPIRTIKIRQ